MFCQVPECLVSGEQALTFTNGDPPLIVCGYHLDKYVELMVQSGAASLVEIDALKHGPRRAMNNMRDMESRKHLIR